MERHFKQEKLKIEVLNIREEREHFHQDIELLFVLEGTLDVAMGEQTTHMQPEDIQEALSKGQPGHSFCPALHYLSVGE